MTLSSESAVQLSLKQYTSIISSLPLAKETSAIVNRIIRYIREAKLKPDLVFYTALIDYYAKRALLDQTLEIYQAMLSDNIKPNVVTYAKSGHLETGKVFRSMHRVGIFPNIAQMRLWIFRRDAKKGHKTRSAHEFRTDSEHN
ncbi:949_t:CDS:1 [Paraglomus brasilianum]|uniref:949_t:CDS:1 n=1 Tax=Paraglomus brasilianum TaxID=144538 RepID=A0A9N9CZ30_9GLOM|nr:949_t:CDS:1 [Paraglomus brasilianum]